MKKPTQTEETDQLTTGKMFVEGARAAHDGKPLSTADSCVEPYRSSWIKGWKAYTRIIRK
jgi:hypothetical protein